MDSPGTVLDHSTGGQERVGTLKVYGKGGENSNLTSEKVVVGKTVTTGNWIHSKYILVLILIQRLNWISSVRSTNLYRTGFNYFNPFTPIQNGSMR